MLNHTHFCNTCGTRFETDGYYDYLCPDCIKTHGGCFSHAFCVQCGKPLGTMTVLRKDRGGTGRFPYEMREGSVLCQSCRENPVPHIRTCPTCGKEFHPKGGQKWCSPECKAQKRGNTPRSTIEAHRKAALRWQKSNKEKAKAQSLAKYYPDKLVIVYECPCDAERKHNHHHDYTKPLEVLRLCPDCHRKEHARLRSLMDEAI